MQGCTSQCGASTGQHGARGRWQAAALAGYEYGYHKFCECQRESPPETTVTVRDRKVVGVRHRPAGTTTDVPAADKNLDYSKVLDALDIAMHNGVKVTGLIGDQKPGTVSTIEGDQRNPTPAPGAAGAPATKGGAK